MSRPRLLDLFAGAGGAAVGYHRAGFDVVGVDIGRQRHYPFEFHQGDSLEYLAEHGHEFNVIHASPPCQLYSVTKHSHHKLHPDLYAPTRAALVDIGRPWVIENVPGVPMTDAVTLCGSMFDLHATDTDGTELVLRRHRLFESSTMILAPGPCRHDDRQVGGVYGGGSSDRAHAKNVRCGGYTPKIAVARVLMGIDWMPMTKLAQAIPPVYTEYIGGFLLDALGCAA
jgi:DNA (cytosine-5)-methyltransferase 1